MAEAIDIRFERIAVDRLCSHARLVVVDGLGGVMQQSGYFLTVGYAQSHQGIDAGFRGQRVGSWHLQLAFWKQEQGRRIKLRCPPKVLTGTLHPSLPSIFSG